MDVDANAAFDYTDSVKKHGDTSVKILMDWVDLVFGSAGFSTAESLVG